MKKILMIVAALAAVMLGFAGPASANDDQPDADNKKVTLCHATSSDTNPYEKITVSVSAFYNAGHIDHAGDIWEAFSYVTKGGDTVNVPAQGDTSLLAFEDCEKPDEDTPVTKPDAVFADPCGTANDVFSVPAGQGYTVGAVQVNGAVQSITVTLDDGFVWADGTSAPLVFERPVFTDVDCDIPDTGAPEFATGMGFGALAMVLAVGGVMLLRRRQTA
jgi:hypothetical protein